MADLEFAKRTGNQPNRPALIANALVQRGYPAQVAEKVLGGNFQRVFAQTWS